MIKDDGRIIPMFETGFDARLTGLKQATEGSVLLGEAATEFKNFADALNQDALPNPNAIKDATEKYTRAYELLQSYANNFGFFNLEDAVLYMQRLTGNFK